MQVVRSIGSSFNATQRKYIMAMQSPFFNKREPDAYNQRQTSPNAAAAAGAPAAPHACGEYRRGEQRARERG